MGSASGVNSGVKYIMRRPSLAKCRRQGGVAGGRQHLGGILCSRHRAASACRHIGMAHRRKGGEAAYKMRRAGISASGAAAKWRNGGVWRRDR